ncbi:MAG: hypothetical protein US50_C0023G0010 [Candidatus Nomurabacteria bacterium GW2011_GWB1_37_5]|uniref:Uncharacterized protein n=1 Tax=Candidatus Nomurabacteria bacterium GW2011_GWB1_37_5 TaxID=1618742 RepID=A0A0G0GVZ9_9BACT|nr:MAG: hypothetical protein US50_C0023G0010 [Candidatus Nomurabacteria bacterium GW2011_GWB1_37_5]
MSRSGASIAESTTTKNFPNLFYKISVLGLSTKAQAQEAGIFSVTISGSPNLAEVWRLPALDSTFTESPSSSRLYSLNSGSYVVSVLSGNSFSFTVDASGNVSSGACTVVDSFADCAENSLTINGLPNPITVSGASNYSEQCGHSIFYSPLLIGILPDIPYLD